MNTARRTDDYLIKRPPLQIETTSASRSSSHNPLRKPNGHRSASTHASLARKSGADLRYAQNAWGFHTDRHREYIQWPLSQRTRPPSAPPRPAPRIRHRTGDRTRTGHGKLSAARQLRVYTGQTLWSRLGSNQRPSACEADALPLSHGTGAERQRGGRLARSTASMNAPPEPATTKAPPKTSPPEPATTKARQRTSRFVPVRSSGLVSCFAPDDDLARCARM